MNDRSEKIICSAGMGPTNERNGMEITKGGHFIVEQRHLVFATPDSCCLIWVAFCLSPDHMFRSSAFSLKRTEIDLP